MRGRTRLPSGTVAIPSAAILWVGIFAIASLPKYTSPLRTRLRPRMVRISVLFPAPLAPRIQVTVPGLTSTVTPFSTSARS